LPPHPSLLVRSILASFLLTLPVVAEEAPAPKRREASVSVGYVLVPFVLTDLNGKPVKGLKQKDVVVLVDGRAVATDLFAASDDAPVSFTILLDGSGSMGLVGKMDGAKAAVRELVAQQRPGDDFALFVFSEGAVREVVSFTTEGKRIVQAVDEVHPFGKTAFFDALVKMPEKSLQGRNGARAIILLTDGLDNASTLTRDDVAVILQAIDVPVYPVGLRSPGSPTDVIEGRNPEAFLNLEILGHIARLTGGRLAILNDPGQLPEAVRLIEKDLRAQYLVGFSPTGRGPVKYRRISLRISGPARPVRVRAGYTGTLPPFKGG
jgi:Ca-activated chloride channel family protein